MPESNGPQRISRARFDWLSRESERWRDAGLIEETTRADVLVRYEPAATHAGGITALVVLAALMAGIGVLLLIGYNWDRLGPWTKVVIMMSGVAALFAGSAVAYRRRHTLAAETLALIATFTFSNSIWLIAQVLHIQGHFPDAFMWSAIGALAVAIVMRSRWIGVEAAVFAAVWVLAAGIAPPRTPPLAFLPVAAATFATAYSLRSPNMLRITALACALWIVVIDPERLFEETQVVFFAAVPLTGCAFYGIGAWHRADLSMRRAWQTTGLMVLLVSFLVLLVSDFHQAVRGGEWRTPATAAGLIAGALSATLFRARLRDTAGIAVATLAILLVIWTALLLSGVRQPQHVWVTVFSVIALFLSVALMRTALRVDDAAALAFGTLFGLEFLIVRWTSVIGNMLWSGLMLLAAGAGLLFMARLWRHRHRTFETGGRLS